MSPADQRLIFGKPPRGCRSVRQYIVPVILKFYSEYCAVFRIRDVYPGSRIRLFSIPDPGSELSPSRIPDPGSSSKNLSILTPKKAKKWFLSSKKYDPGCSSRIPDPDADFLPSRIPDPGVKKVPNPGSGSATLVLRIQNMCDTECPFHAYPEFVVPNALL